MAKFKTKDLGGGLLIRKRNQIAGKSVSVGKGNPHNRYAINKKALVCVKNMKKKELGVTVSFHLCLRK